MELYFSQHGDAKSEEEDPERPLTERGRAETARVGRAAAAAGLDVRQIWHSGKRRARETAEIFAEALGAADGVHAKEWLGPTDPPGPVVEAARNAPGPVLLVGHLPFMSRLASLLLTGDPDAGVIETRCSAIVGLVETEEGDGSGRGWALRWYLRPEGHDD